MVEKFVIGAAALIGLLASQNAALRRQNDRPQPRSETRPTIRQHHDVRARSRASDRAEGSVFNQPRGASPRFLPRPRLVQTGD